MTIENEEDYNEFMENIVDKSNPDHVVAYEVLKENLLSMFWCLCNQIQFILCFVFCLESHKNSTSNKETQKIAASRNSVNGSTESTSNSTLTSNTLSLNKENKQVDRRKKQQQQTKHESKQLPQKQQPQTPSNVQPTFKEQDQKQTANSSKKGKKLKFVNFYSQDHKPGLLKGQYAAY